MMAAVQWLYNGLIVLLEYLFNIIIDLIQHVIDSLPTFMLSVVQLFTYYCPPPPFMTQGSISSGASGSIMSIMLQTLNWIFPMSFVIGYIQFMICAIIAYFMYCVIMRWLKITT